MNVIIPALADDLKHGTVLVAHPLQLVAIMHERGACLAVCCRLCCRCWLSPAWSCVAGVNVRQLGVLRSLLTQESDPTSRRRKAENATFDTARRMVYLEMVTRAAKTLMRNDFRKWVLACLCSPSRPTHTLTRLP